MELTEYDRTLLAGEHGEAAQLSMRLLVKTAKVLDAPNFISITSAHIDSCIYHGPVGIDFAERLVAGGGQVTVPTTLNVSSLDLRTPEHFKGDAETAVLAKRQMDAYVALGARPTWTCAPYQMDQRPAFGEQIAWAESNAIVFANSVLGARTNRYGDLIDICAAITGRVPNYGLHQTAARRGQVVFRPKGIPDYLLQEDVFYAILGHIIGAEVGTNIPVIDGLPHTVTEDQLKALGAASASSGAVPLFHVVGVTPEAPTLADALQHQPPLAEFDVTLDHIRQERDALTTAQSNKLVAVSLGTPHFSVTEFGQVVELLEGLSIHPDVDVWISTGRTVLAEVARRGWFTRLKEAGIHVVVDTCTYVTPIMNDRPGAVMTNSAKWAHYAPGNLDIKAIFGSLKECMRSAERGEVWRDESLWN